MKRSLLLLSLICFVNASAQVDHWEQLVNAHDPWTYFKGNSEPPSNWNTVSFNDSSWLTGKGSIGYGDNDDSTTISNVSSIYMRKTFTVSQKNTLQSLVLHSDFDDGFVAYLNGVEIARANIADSLQPPAHDDVPMESRETTTHNGPTTWQGGVPAAWVIDETLWSSALVNGNNVFAVHTLDSTNSWDLTTKYWLHCATSSNTLLHDSAASWFEFNSFESPVAIIRVNSFGKDITKNEKIDAYMDIVWDENSSAFAYYSGITQLQTKIGIKKRGRVSLFNFPKNGYTIESKDSFWEDDDIEPLNFPKEEDWVLHGPWADRTFMRNALAMHLTRKTGNYASRTAYVELFVNGEYEGIYVLMEKIKRDNDRVDIAKLNPDEISGDDLSGGYIWSTDWWDANWYSTFYPYGTTNEKVKYQYIYPKEGNIAPEQETYIQNLVDDFEHSLQNTSIPYKGKYWDEYLDINSFVDYFLVQELTKNIDGFRASTYYHKDKNSKDSLIKMGPVWDFNYSLGLTSVCNGYEYDGFQYNGYCSAQIPAWWRKLVLTPAFADAVNCRWKELRSTVWHEDSIMAFIGDNELILDQVAQRNHDRWPLDPGTVPLNVQVIDSTYAGDVDIMETWVSNRLDWLDSNMIGSDCATFSLEEEIALRKNLRLYPNPSTGNITLLLLNGLHGDLQIRNQLGQIVHVDAIEEGTTKVNLGLNHLENGIYFVEVKTSVNSVYQKLVIQH